MDDREVEELLRKAWNPAPSADLKQRALRQSRLHLSSSRPAAMWRTRWETALVSCLLLIIGFSKIDEGIRQTQLSALMGTRTDGINTMLCNAMTPVRLRYRMAMRNSALGDNWLFQAIGDELDEPCSKQ